MVVYVDPTFQVTPTGADAARYGDRWCHMIADTEEELHAFAAKIGMQRSWAQNPGTPSAHYDLVPSRRTRAVKAGAQEITHRELSEKIVERRKAARAAKESQVSG